MEQARKSGGPWEKEVEVPAAALKAVEWMAKRTPREAIEQREATLRRIRALAKKFEESGASVLSCLPLAVILSLTALPAGETARWFDGCDHKVKEVSHRVNGPLLVALAEATGFHDKACIEFFRRGAPLLGVLEFAGNGGTKEFPKPESADDLWWGTGKQNEAMFAKRREDANSERLMELTVADAKQGRMSEPRQVEHGDADVLLSRRFGVEQGVLPDASTKVRPVDDFSASGVNACCQPTENLRQDCETPSFHMHAPTYLC